MSSNRYKVREAGQVRQKNVRQDALLHVEPGFAAQLREDLPEADLRYVLQIFADDLARLTNQIADAAQQGEGTQLRRTAHALAGAAAAVGAQKLEAACRDAQADTSAGKERLCAHAEAIAVAAAATRDTMEHLHLSIDPVAGSSTDVTGAKA
jgi:HPt (histidine-containing phosphotransfer) domain-containing protein